MWEERHAYRQTDGGLDSKIISKLILQKNLAQNRYKRGAVLDTFSDHVSNY
jgi:uncharacterized protein (UPF0335 family)